MADRGPHAPVPKASGAKTAHQTKTMEPPQKKTLQNKIPQKLPLNLKQKR